MSVLLDHRELHLLLSQLLLGSAPQAKLLGYFDSASHSLQLHSIRRVDYARVACEPRLPTGDYRCSAFCTLIALLRVAKLHPTVATAAWGGLHKRCDAR